MFVAQVENSGDGYFLQIVIKQDIVMFHKHF